MLTDDGRPGESPLAHDPTLCRGGRSQGPRELVSDGRKAPTIATELDLPERELRRLLVKLDAAKLIELQPKLKVRLRTSNVISWRSNGPLRRLYEQQVKTEFLQSDFIGRHESIGFASAELSEGCERRDELRVRVEQSEADLSG